MELTLKARLVRVVNVLSKQEDELLVACEDTMDDIQVSCVHGPSEHRTELNTTEEKGMLPSTYDQNEK